MSFLRNHFGFAFLFFFYHTVAANAGQKLYFPVSENNLQPLAQRFTYDLSSPGKFQIGDLKIEAQHINLLFGSSAKSKNQMLFRWPSGLLRSGTISIIGSDGKAIWKQDVSEEDLSESKNSSLSEYRSRSFDPKILSKMNQSAFISFCISKVTSETKIYVCTREFKLAQNSNGFQLQTSDIQSKQPYVEINGKIVAPQGLVYLNKGQAELLLRAQLTSGESIELLTSGKLVHFLDVVEDPKNQENLIITTKGAEPTRGDHVKKVDGETFEITLPKNRPVYYLVAEGELPLRQELQLKGPVPLEKDRIIIDSGYTQKTYSSEVVYRGAIPKGVRLKANENTSRITNEGDEFTWTMTELQSGQTNRRALQVLRDNLRFIASTEIERKSPNELRLELGVKTSPTNALGGLLYRRWFNGMRWAFDAHVNDNSSLLGFSMRFRPGFAEDLNSSGLRVLYGQRTNKQKKTISSPAAQLFFQSPMKTPFSDFVGVQLTTWASGGTKLDLEFINEWKPRWFYAWKLGATENNESSLSIGTVHFF